MREILFRGKRTYNGEWVDGCLYRNIYGEYQIREHKVYDEEAYIDDYNINLETIGQYTGMKDIKDKKIFEGDIVKFKRVNALGYTISRVGEVQYYDELPIFYIYANTGDAWDWVDCEEIEVIGNIHDNPELMEREYD